MTKLITAALIITIIILIGAVCWWGYLIYKIFIKDKATYDQLFNTISLTHQDILQNTLPVYNKAVSDLANIQWLSDDIKTKLNNTLNQIIPFLNTDVQSSFDKVVELQAKYNFTSQLIDYTAAISAAGKYLSNVLAQSMDALAASNRILALSEQSITTTTASIAQQTTSINALKTNIADLQNKIVSTTADITRINNALMTCDKSLADAQSMAAGLKTTLDSINTAIQKLIVDLKKCNDDKAACVASIQNLLNQNTSLSQQMVTKCVVKESDPECAWIKGPADVTNSKNILDPNIFNFWSTDGKTIQNILTDPNRSDAISELSPKIYMCGWCPDINAGLRTKSYDTLLSTQDALYSGDYRSVPVILSSRNQVRDIPKNPNVCASVFVAPSSIESNLSDLTKKIPSTMKLNNMRV